MIILPIQYVHDILRWAYRSNAFKSGLSLATDNRIKNEKEVMLKVIQRTFIPCLFIKYQFDPISTVNKEM